MSLTNSPEPRTAAQIRAENARLDADLLAEAALIDPAVIGGAPEREWSAAQVLAHLGASAHLVARELACWHDDPDGPVGRTLEHPESTAAVESPAGELSALTTGMRTAFTILVGSLNELDDADIEAPTNNVTYGNEPLSAFIDRHVLGHKAAHLDQLRGLRTGEF